MSELNGFKNYAFISYNHKDWKKAKRLQKQLEHYRLPVVAREEIGQDVRIRPVFRYVENLPLGDLREELKKELDSSKYLIVICSPNSARPNVRGEHWVNDEVKRFIKRGRKDYIIPVIVDGEPNAGGEKECFPPALRDAGIVGANFAKGRNRKELRIDFLKIVAKLLDLLPDQLIRHVEEEEARSRWFKWLKIMPLVMFSCVVGLFVWDMLRPVTMYFADYVDCYGLPEGIYEVKKCDIRMRSSTYRFDYRGYYWGGIHGASLPSGLLGVKRKLRRVSHIGPSFIPKIESHELRATRPEIMDFTYDSENRLMRKTYKKRGGKDFFSGPIVKKLHYENRYEKDRLVVNGRMWETFDDGEFYFLEGNITQRDTMYNQTDNVRTRITHMDIFRDGEGRMFMMRFLSAPDLLPACDKDGVGGLEYILTDGSHGEAPGRVCEIRHLNTSGKRCVDRYGVATIKIGYKGPDIAYQEYLDIERRLVKGREGYFRSQWFYDGWGNSTNQVLRNNRDEKAYRILGEEKKSTEHPGTYHWAELALVYSNGLMVARSAYGPDGKLVSGDGDIATVLSGYNDLGDEIYREFLNAKGERMISPQGSSVVRFNIDRTTGMRTACRLYGKDGKTPCYDINERVAGYEWTVDSKTGLVTEQCFVDGEGKVIAGRYGYARYCLSYDDKGRCRRVVCYDNATNVCENGSVGGNVACVTWEYAASVDGWDKCLYWQDSAATKRATAQNGYSGFITKYDASGRTEECWDVNESDVKKTGVVLQYGQLATREEIVLGHWAEAGWKEIRSTWYTSEGNVSKENRWIVKREIQDEFNRPVFTFYEDLDRNLMEDTSGIAIKVCKWDVFGNIKATFYYDKNKKPTFESESDTAGCVWTYDIETGNMQSKEFLDIDQRTPRRIKGETYSKIQYFYPKEGTNRVITTYWHKNDKVNCANNYHKQIADFLDANCGYLLDQWYFDKDGIPTDRVDSNGFRYHHARCEYDEWYNRIRVMRYDVNEKIMQPEGDGYCLKEYRYDALNRESECLWVAKPTDGAKRPAYAEFPGADQDGVSRMTKKYLKNSRTISRTDEYRLKDAPCLYGSTGVWHKVTMYDIQGNETNCCTYASDGELICDSNNIHTRTIAYFDDAVRHKRRDLYGKDMWGRKGVVHAVTWYDKSENVIEESYFGEGESPMGDKDGAVRFVREYFPDSKIVCRLDEFGLKGAPCLYGSTGVWHKVTMYDIQGNATNCCTYASDGELICDSNNVHTRTIAYFDDAVRHKRRDLYGKDMWGRKGVVHAVTWYDKSENVIEESYFGEGENPKGDKDGAVRFVRGYFPDSKIYGRLDEFGLKGAPCLYGSTGVWHKVTMYDVQGNETNCCTYASDGELICDSNNVHTRTIAYFDDAVRYKRRDLYGKDMWGRKGVVHAVTWYDKSENVIEESYFGEGESPKGDKDGAVRFVRGYFPDSKIVCRLDEFGLKGAPCLYGSTGVWHKVTMYDIQGNATNCCTYASDGELICDSNNVHTRTIAYFDDAVRHKRRDLYGKDMWDAKGVVHAVTWYDKSENVIEESYFGEGESPKGDKDGMVRFIREYFPDSKIYGRLDEFGLKGASCLYGSTGVWHKVTMYDVQGNETNCCTYASDGELICDSNNVHTRTIAYFDDAVRHKRRDLYGKDMWDAKGVVHAVTWYDKSENVIEESYFGEGESPKGDKDGMVRFIREYFPDSKIYGRLDEFGLKNAPCLHGNKGVWHRVTMYDIQGNETNCCTYAADGKPICKSNNVHTRTIAYFDDPARHVRYDLYGKDIWFESGLSHVVRYLDDKNRIVEEFRFDASGNPLPDIDGSVRIINEYVGDKKMLARREEFGLENGAGIYGFDGLTRLVTIFDKEDGDLIAMAGYEADGKKHVFKHVVFRFGNISESDALASLGIATGDILCKFNDVDLLSVTSLKEFKQILSEESGNRRLVLARKDAKGGFTMFAVNLPSAIKNAECLRRPIRDKEYIDINVAVKRF